MILIGQCWDYYFCSELQNVERGKNAGRGFRLNFYAKECL